MNLQLTGKCVAITGASKGIGRAVAEAFAGEGCDLVLGARDGKTLHLLSDALQRKHDVDVICTAVDLSTAADQQRFADAAREADILVNCAGSNPAGRLGDVSDEAWRQSWDLKVFGYINLTRALYSRMKSRGGGVIVNVIGNSAERMNDAYILGSTGNLALVGLTRALGSASPDDGIRVVGVNPGLTATDRVDVLMRGLSQQKFGTPDRASEVLAQMRLPFGRPASSAEVADAVLFLASARAAYISGTILTVDGGAAHRHGG